MQADRILGLWAELLEPAPKEAVLGDELLAAFNCWLGENGHHTWTLETFVRAFETHAETTRHGVARERTARKEVLDALSRWVAPAPAGFAQVVHAPRRLKKQEQVWLGIRFRSVTDAQAPARPASAPPTAAEPPGNSGESQGCSPEQKSS